MLDTYKDTNDSVSDELGLFTPTESTVPNPPPIFNVKGDIRLFDVDPYTGFMPLNVPLPRLPSKWEAWEVLLDDAVAAKLQVGDNIGAMNEDTVRAEHWRSCVRSVSLEFQPQVPAYLPVRSSDILASELPHNSIFHFANLVVLDSHTLHRRPDKLRST